MSALPFPTYGLSNLFLFPVYQSREAYREACGVEPPPYDPSRAAKLWFDPKAASSRKRKLIYENVIAIADNGGALVGADGRPILEPLLITREEAATVNIPREEGNRHFPQLSPNGRHVPVPLRPLEPAEELYFEFGATVAVKNTDLYTDLQGGFRKSDRALLRAIAEKLGIDI